MKQERRQNGRCNRVVRLKKPDGLLEARDFSHGFFTYDEAGKLITERELLFRTGDGYVVPEFRTYEDVRRFWGYPNRAKLEVKRKMIYDVKEV